MQVAKTGSFQDPRYGKFKITVKDFASWLKNFNAFALSDGRLGLPVDVDHSPEKRGDTEAYGWVKALEQRGDEMWARVEWNDQGKGLIEDRRYAYISPSYSPDYKDEEGNSHGTALMGIALTNRPFLQMATVNLSQFTFAAAQSGDNDPDDAVTDLDDLMLDISDEARQKHAVVVKKVGGQTKHMFPIPPGDKVHARAALSLLPRAIAAGHITPGEAETIKNRAHEVLGDGGRQHSAYIPERDDMELNQILTSLGLSRSDLNVAEDAEDAVVLAALTEHQKTLTAPTPPEGSVTLSQDQVNQLLADASAGRQAAETLRINTFDTAFDKAQNAGKVVLAQKDTFRALYDQSADNTLKLLSELQPAVNMTPAGHGGAPLNIDPAAAALSSKYEDTVTPMGVDTDGLKLLAKAEAIQVAQNVSFERALELAEAGVEV